VKWALNFLGDSSLNGRINSPMSAYTTPTNSEKADHPMHQTLIDRDVLKQRIGDPGWVIVDCRFDLADPNRGEREYLEGHIPGAVYAHLDRDLSGPPVICGGRHPLPAPDALNQLFSRLGIDGGKQVVAYDNAGGSLAAARLWWLLRYMGHEAVVVLDGGWGAWREGVKSGEETNSPAAFRGQPNDSWIVKADAVSKVQLLIDSRDPARYRGEVEPIDPKAGHIPCAVNHFWKLNLGADGRFLSPAQLRENFRGVFRNMKPDDAVFYCGSGVTACHNLLAVAHAGFSMPRLYAGSWSEWCSDPSRPVATGE
jgi:thiosulfate/3-mercaptopyruvate sulfurtransferase